MREDVTCVNDDEEDKEDDDSNDNDNNRNNWVFISLDKGSTHKSMNNDKVVD